MDEQQPIARSRAEANLIVQLGMLRGAALGAGLSFPLALAAGLVGTWLDAKLQDPSNGWCLAVVVLVTSGFVGAFWTGQSAAMRDWPAACRAAVWAEWRRGLAISVPLGVPVAILLGWLALRDEGSWSVALGIGLEVGWVFAGVGTLVGYDRGEKSARRALYQAGYVRFGWFSYGAPLELTRETSSITERTGFEKGPPLPGRYRPPDSPT
jgi:hypothetical protein